MHTFFKVVSSGNNLDLVAAIAGGVIGGLVIILLIALLGFGIAAVTLSLRKKGEYNSSVLCLDNIFVNL
jgi:hypothetical protein